MFRKELQDTAKSFLVILLFISVTAAFSFFVLRQIFSIKLAFRDFLLYFSWFGTFLVTLYLGSSVFSKERTGKTFEYFYSLPVPRWKVMVYKIVPPALSMFIFIGLYFFFNAVLYHSMLPMNPGTFIMLTIFIFVFSVSMSLMYKNDSMTFISNFLGFLVIFAVAALVILGINYSEYADPRLVILFVIPFGIISVALFAGFVLRFKKFDMTNMSVLSRKNVFQVMLPVVCLLLLYIGINMVDSGKPADSFTVKDLAPARYDKANGFYRLWTLGEPPDTDIQSDAVIIKYRRLFDPAYDNGKFLAVWNPYHYKKKISEYLNKIRIAINFENSVAFDIQSTLWVTEDKIKKMRSEGSFLLDRYQALIDTPVIEDFTSPRWNIPIFNHLVWLRVAKFYLAVNAVDAVNGRWEQGVSNILSHIDFARRVVKKSRTHLTGLIGLSLANTSLQLLAALMNRDDCPAQVFQQILESLPPLKPGDFSIGNNLVFEYLSFVDFIEEGQAEEERRRYIVFRRLGRALFLQENRTIGYMNRLVKEIKHLEEIPPHQWKRSLKETASSMDKTSGWWWLVNPVGKSIYRSYGAGYINISKIYKSRALYELTRISADLHKEDNPALPMEQVLAGLGTYKTIDQCSGKPYKWNPRKGVLYSIGTDRTDNGGVYDWATSSIDFILPVKLRGRQDRTGIKGEEK